MELGKFATLPTAPCVIKEPERHEPTDFIIEVHGLYSDRYRPALTACAQRNGGDTSPNLWDAEFYADLTESWKGLTDGGKAVKFSHAKAVELYTGYPHLRFQLYNHILGLKSFLPNA